ncbi:MAG: bacterial ig-like protein [Chlorobi bacterium]|nr:bacterial ig-like protein [Chlorobiota bacterium]
MTGGVRAQTTRGREFWTGFMVNPYTPADPIKLTLFITSSVNANGTVSIPRSGWQTTFSVGANSVVKVDLPTNDALAIFSDGPEPKGVHIVASDTIDVYALNYVRRSLDASLVFSNEALGTDYLVASYPGLILPGGNLPSEFMIIATQDGTDVEITPASPTYGGHLPGTPYTITINSGYVYQVQSDSDLTGSRVRSLNGKPFALISGCAGGQVPVGTPYTDHLYEQQYPISSWGTEFIAIPLASRSGDTYRILAASDGTSVTLDSGATFTLNAGQFRELLMTTATEITSSAPITVAQFSNGANFDHVGLADPFMLMLTPTDRRRRTITIDAIALNTTYRHFVNIATPTAGVGRIRLDGGSIASFFTPLPSNPLFSVASIPLNPGDHTLASALGFTAYVYGFGDLEAYGYSTGTENPPPCLSPFPIALGPTGFCQGDSVAFDAGGGFLAYSWSNGDSTRLTSTRVSGDYYVTTTDSNGCVQRSPSLITTVFALPQPAITVQGSLVLCPCDSVILTAAPAPNYLWSNGERTQSIVVRGAGTFSVGDSNAFGCSAVSAPVTVITNEQRASVAVGSGEAAPGERIAIPLYLRQGGSLADCGIRDFVATIRFNRTILNPMQITGASVVSDVTNGGDRVVTIRGTRGGDTLAVMEFGVTLGNSIATPVALDSFRWDGCNRLPTDTVGGAVALRGLCTDGGTRLVSALGDLTLKRNAPDPFSSATAIDYETVEGGRTRLYLVDAVGRRALTLVDADISPGRYRVDLDGSSLGAGIYWYVLETPTARLSRPMHIVR